MATPTNGPDEVLLDGKFLRYVRRGTWEFVQRKKVSGIVGIVAVTDAKKLLLVEQYRVPLKRNVIEIPAGLAGDVAGHETEPLENAAARELLEETGYEAKTFTYLTEGAVSAGLTDETVTLFRAEQLKKVNAGGGDGTENITVHEIPLADVRRWLDDRRRGGTMIDLKVYSGLSFCEGA